MRYYRVFVLTLSFWMCSCLPYGVKGVVTNPDTALDITFEGVLPQLTANNVVNVLIVHGMGTHDSTYADKFLAGFVNEAHLSVQTDCTLVLKQTTQHGSYYTVHRCVYRRDVRREVRVYILTWSNLTEVFENEILAYDWQYYGRRRVRVNRQLKQRLIDTAFADAVVFTGTYAPVLRRAVEDAICVALTDKKQLEGQCKIKFGVDDVENEVSRQPPLFLVSHSLGSALVIDTIASMLPSCEEPEHIELNRGRLELPPTPTHATALARVFVKRLNTVFLLANQLPLLYLAKIKPPIIKQEHDPSFAAIQGFVSALCPLTLALSSRAQPVPLVAFNDSNDLLTFPLPAGWRERIAPDAVDRLKLLNIRVVNAPYRWLNIAVNPSRAHTDYWSNQSVIRYVVHGNAK